MTDTAPGPWAPVAESPSTTSVQRAVAALAEGRMVVVTDDADREDEGDLVVAADAVTPAQLGFVVRHTTGIVCARVSPPLPASLDCWASTCA